MGRYQSSGTAHTDYALVQIRCHFKTLRYKRISNEKPSAAPWLSLSSLHSLIFTSFICLSLAAISLHLMDGFFAVKASFFSRLFVGASERFCLKPTCREKGLKSRRHWSFSGLTRILAFLFSAACNSRDLFLNRQRSSVKARPLFWHVGSNNRAVGWLRPRLERIRLRWNGDQIITNCFDFFFRISYLIIHKDK